MKTCDTCRKEWPIDRFRADNPNPNACFKCRSAGISLSLQGGKSYWNEDTETRRRESALSEARAAGMDPVPTETGAAWSGASASSLAKIGDVSKKNGAFGKKATESTTVAAGMPSKNPVGAI